MKSNESQKFNLNLFDRLSTPCVVYFRSHANQFITFKWIFFAFHLKRAYTSSSKSWKAADNLRLAHFDKIFAHVFVLSLLWIFKYDRELDFGYLLNTDWGLIYGHSDFVLTFQVKDSMSSYLLTNIDGRRNSCEVSSQAKAKVEYMSSCCYCRKLGQHLSFTQKFVFINLKVMLMSWDWRCSVWAVRSILKRLLAI